MKQIFTNNASSELVSALSATATSISVMDATNFPVPVVGEEFFKITLVGACSTRVEVVRIIENNGASLTADLRGDEDTTAQDFFAGDGVYHALTAGTLEIMVQNSQWYLGAFDDPPLADNEGYPLVEGHIYYQKASTDPDVVGQVMVWDGESWRPFSPIIGGVQIGAYTWLQETAETGPFDLTWPDAYGQQPVDFGAEGLAFDVFLNGSKLIENVDVAVPADYEVDRGTDTITILHDSQIGDVFECKVLLRVDDESLDYIQRQEIDASAYGFVLGDGETTLVPETLLPTVEYVDTAISTVVDPITAAVMTWHGNWVNQNYLQNNVVRDGNWLAIANKDTTQRPAPQAVGDPEYAMPDTPSMVDLDDLVEVVMGNTYTFQESGWLAQARVYVPNSTNHLFNVQVINVSTGGNLVYETQDSALSPDAWNIISIPKVVVELATKIRVQVVMTNTLSGQIDYNYVANYWSTNSPTWSNTGGYLMVAGVEQAGFAAHAFGVEAQFQSATVATDWDIMADSGGGGGGAGGAGGGPLHTVSDTAPTNAEGNDGDIWMVPVTSS